MEFKQKLNIWTRKSIYSVFKFNELNKDEKYISILTTKNQLPNGKTFEFNHYRSDNHHIISSRVSNILSFLNEFRTIYDHAIYIESRKLANFNMALLSLKELWKSGLLISQSDFFNELKKRESDNVIPSINTLAWITQDRAESIKQGLESFIKDKKTNHKNDLIVFDDSTTDNYLKVKQNIALLNTKYLTNIKLVGKSERSKFLKELIHKLKGKVPKYITEYGLMGLNNIKHRTGANRNTFLLYTIGKHSLLTDDDILCEIYKNGDDQKLTLTSNVLFSELSTEFFLDQKHLNKKIKFEYNDPISIHQKLLGHSIVNLISKYKDHISLNTITPTFVYDSLTTEKRVRVTMMGTAGDSGVGFPIYKIFMKGDSLIKLISDTQNFSSKMNSRTVLQSYKTFTVGPPSFLMGMNLGIDNTELLPPFHPNFRNSDGIFASVLRKCFVNSFIGHLPFAISHIPPNVRSVDSSDLFSTRIRIPDALNFSINEFINKATTIEGGLRSLGIYIRDISEKSSDDLNQYFVLMNTKLITNNICYLEYIHKQNKHINKEWSQITERRIEVLNKWLKDRNLSIIFKEPTDLSCENQLLLVKEVYRNFGNLLYYWPDIYNCVKKYKRSISVY
jgi:hypothetical protein